MHGLAVDEEIGRYDCGDRGTPEFAGESRRPPRRGVHEIRYTVRSAAPGLFSERIFQRVALQGEPLRAFRRDVHVVFETHSEFSL